MLIEVFGSGCAKCETLTQNAKKAVELSGGDHAVVKINDFAAIAARGILGTPALAIDGKLRFQGKVASADEILSMLKA
ncbi:MAG: redox-active disulfide protein 2 [Holophagaceae bacterium]|nr:redox-active disulfide protein 2 [Holophagaceae bacterium]